MEEKDEEGRETEDEGGRGGGGEEQRMTVYRGGKKCTHINASVSHGVPHLTQLQRGLGLLHNLLRGGDGEGALPCTYT